VSTSLLYASVEWVWEVGKSARADVWNFGIEFRLARGESSRRRVVVTMRWKCIWLVGKDEKQDGSLYTIPVTSVVTRYALRRGSYAFVIT